MGERRSMIDNIGCGRFGRVVVARLAPGTDLMSGLNEIVQREGVRAGVILSCVAFLDHAVLRNVEHVPDRLPITDADRVFVEKDGPYEVLSLAGNIRVQEDAISVHAHIVISAGDGEARAYGGHLVPGCRVFHLAEVIIGEICGVQLNAVIDEKLSTAVLHATPVQGVDG